MWIYGLGENNGANNPSTLTACTHQPPSWINIGFSADQYLLFWEFTYPLRWNQVSSPNSMNMESISPSCISYRHQLKKKKCCFTVCVIEFVNQLSYMNANAAVYGSFAVQTKQFCCRCSKSSTSLVQLLFYTSTASSIVIWNWTCCLKFVNCFVEQLHQNTFAWIKRNF